MAGIMLFISAIPIYFLQFGRQAIDFSFSLMFETLLSKVLNYVLEITSKEEREKL